MIVPVSTLLLLLQGAHALRYEAGQEQLPTTLSSAILMPKIAKALKDVVPEALHTIRAFQSILDGVPDPDLLDPAFKYSAPVGSGCNPPVSGPNPVNIIASAAVPAASFLRTTRGGPQRTWDGTIGWNGFCEIGWPACPDATANRDYYYYAKSVGTADWVGHAGSIDGQYCQKNGWLKPENVRRTRNFTAMQEYAAEQCRTTLSDPKYHPNAGLLTGLVEGMKDFDGTTMTEDTARTLAAWNCGLGDVGCDMTYCAYAYCEQPDGSLGIAGECEGWDKIHGMPASWPGGRHP